MSLQEDRRTNALAISLGLTTLWSVLAVGGTLPLTCLVTIILAAATAAAATTLAPRRRASSIAPLVVLFLLSAYSLLQTVPVPVSWLAVLSPAAADIWSRALAPIGGSVSSATISLDPGASTMEAAKYAAYGGVLFASSLLARARGAAQGLLIVFGSGCVVALVSAAHEIVGAKSLFGLYEPENPFGKISPLLNANTLAGYLNLSALCGVGLLYARQPVLPRPLLAAGLAVVLTMSLRTASRGGAIMLGLAVALWLVFVLLRRRRGHREGPGLSTLMLGGAAAGFACVVVVLTSSDAFWGDLFSPNLQKASVATLVRSVVADYATVGMGRGAFESVFVAYRPETALHVTYTHAENLPAQWIAEWGFAIAVTALAALAWLFRPGNVGAMNSSRNAAAFAGAFALVGQNFGDLGLELPGPAIALSVVLGSLWGDVTRRRPVRHERARMHPRLGWIFVALVVLAGALYLARGFRPLASDRQRAAHALLAARTPESRAAFRADLTEAILRHPADYYFPLLGALAVPPQDASAALPWLQRALERGPNIARTHVALAEVLHRRGATNQALLELRLAVEYEPPLRRTVAEAALRFTRDFDQLVRAVPEGEAGGHLLDDMARLLGPSDEALRARLDAEAVIRAPALRGPRERSAAALILAMTTKKAPCVEPTECLANLRTHGEALRHHHPRSSYGEQLLARAHVFEGDPGAARGLLREACKLPQDDKACLQLLASVEEDGQVQAALDRYVSRACTSKPTCGSAWGHVAAAFAERRDWVQAHGAAKRAAQYVPTTEIWLDAATYAEKGGLYALAVEALRNASALRQPPDPTIEERLNAMKARVN